VIWGYRVDNSLVHMSFRKLVIAVLAMMLVVVVAACSGSLSSDSVGTLVPSPSTEDPSAAVGTSETVAASPTASAIEKLPSLPVFSVATIDGENIRLEDLIGEIPVYVLFIPTTGDEIDLAQMKKLQARYDEFDQLGAKIVVIVAELPNKVLDMRDDLGLQFALIADPLHVVASDWQVFDLDNDGTVSPASFVFDAFGNLAARLVAAEPDDRPSVDEVLFVIVESLSAGAA
jgi:peroxiredoxin